MTTFVIFLGCPEIIKNRNEVN